MTAKIVHNEDDNRYELRVGNEVASIAEYRRQGDRLIFDHTQTDRRFRGQGRAAELVKAALDDVRSRGLRVVPACWFVADYVRDHPEYEDLVA